MAGEGQVDADVEPVAGLPGGPGAARFAEHEGGLLGQAERRGIGQDVDGRRAIERVDDGRRPGIGRRQASVEAVDTRAQVAHLGEPGPSPRAATSPGTSGRRSRSLDAGEEDDDVGSTGPTSGRWSRPPPTPAAVPLGRAATTSASGPRVEIANRARSSVSARRRRRGVLDPGRPPRARSAAATTGRGSAQAAEAGEGDPHVAAQVDGCQASSRPPGPPDSRRYRPRTPRPDPVRRRQARLSGIAHASLRSVPTARTAGTSPRRANS